MKTLGIITATVVAIIYVQLIKGLALSCVWFWFVCPVFGIRPITVVEAVGLGLLLVFWKEAKARSNNEDNKKFEEDLFYAVSYNTVFCLMTFLFGWILSLFI